MSAQSEKQIDLGFVEECDSALLQNVYFPSKVGGKPAWLELDSIPSTDELKCLKCGGPQSFLCQIYAPIEEKEECFHRTIFIFICREVTCFAPNSAENFLVFRSQLPRHNKLYSAVPPDEDKKLDPIEPHCLICAVCGCRGSSMCSRCKKINYCSVKHQRAHWIQHKRPCKLGTHVSNKEITVLSVIFPEFEVVIEQESSPTKDFEGLDYESEEKRRLDEFQNLVDQGKTGTLDEIPESELKKYTADEDEIVDEYFRKFKKRTAANPSQVLRYDLGGEPVWIADVSKTLGDIKIPPCSACNSERQFEFQIMPQMLNYLKDDNIDWGVLAIYTCKNSCNPTNGYAKEFVLKQDILPNDNK